MKIEEPKTPYRIAEGDDNSIDELDAELLADKYVIIYLIEYIIYMFGSRLRKVTSRSSVDEDEDDSTDTEETEDSKSTYKFVNCC